MLLVDSPPQRWARALDGIGAAVVVCGHTHMPFDRLACGHRVVNPGSVGMPYGHPGADWALLGPGIGPSAMSPSRTTASALATSGSASTASRAGRWPWMSASTATLITRLSRGRVTEELKYSLDH